MASMKDCCCGVDVHKSFIIAVIAKLKGKDVIFTGYKRFSTFKKGLLEFKAWLGIHDCYEICMESTGKYYIPVYRTIADETFHVDVVHPKYVKAPRGKKNDKKDAKRIADMYMRDHKSRLPKFLLSVTSPDTAEKPYTRLPLKKTACPTVLQSPASSWMKSGRTQCHQFKEEQIES